MKKLNELVKLAKRATSGEWNAFISAGGDGTFSIHTPDDSRKGNVVNWPGFDTANCSKAQKKANAKYIAAAHPDALFAIAEAFRALEQRAEVAEAKLAEMEKQEPVAVVARRDPRLLWEWTKQGKNIDRPDGMYLYARPAPAINLAELVPDEVLRRLEHEAGHLVHHCHHIDEHSCKVDRRDLLTITEACRVAILRNIEEAK